MDLLGNQRGKLRSMKGRCHSARCASHIGFDHEGRMILKRLSPHRTVGAGDRVLPKSLSRDSCARGESRVHGGISLESAVENIERGSDYIQPKTDFSP